MDYSEVLKKARMTSGPYCKACPICDGRACKNSMPGPGAKGKGLGAIRNYDKWQEVLLNMDTLHDSYEADTTFRMFGKDFKIPVFAGPVGAMKSHYGDLYTDMEYNDILVRACRDNGIMAFTGDGVDPLVMKAATAAIKASGGIGVATVKPWNSETLKEKAALIKAAGPLAVAMDIDAAGLPFLKGQIPPAGFKSESELAEIIATFDMPFIVKGIMTKKGALKALAAGAKGIIVSNHGGRVQEDTPATAEVLKEIADAVKGKMSVFVDGGIRTGTDVFKALALGADGVLIARPFVSMVYGAEDEGVKVFVDKLESELKDAMAMCGAKTLADISYDMVRMSK